MFGSRLLSALGEAENETELIGGEGALRERLAGGHEPKPEILIVDLTDERLDGAAVLEALRAADLLSSLRTLAFFSHVETAVRERAHEAGFDLVVPRSRIAREAPALVAGLGAV